MIQLIKVDTKLLEKVVFLCSSKSALDQILSIINSKFLIMSKPYTAIPSMYTQNLKCLGDDREPMPSFEDAWNDLERRATINVLEIPIILNLSMIICFLILNILN